MAKVWNLIDAKLMEPDPLQVERLPTFYPSSCSCISEEDGSPIGSCLRANYYRCAGYEESDHDSLWSQYVFAGGKLWEIWILDQIKSMGLLLGSNIKFVDVDRYISGEIDGLFLDPETNEKVILEIKTFYGYEARKNLLGNKTVKPKPKDQHLLQAFFYLGHFEGQVKKVILMYFGRDDHARQEFHITAEYDRRKKKTFPKITTTWKGEEYSYIDKRITLEGIYQRFDDLMSYLQKAELPPPDYMHEYTREIIEQKYKDGEISKTRYEAYQKDPEKNPIGYFMCEKYCNYRSMCKAHQEEKSKTSKKNKKK